MDTIFDLAKKMYISAYEKQQALDFIIKALLDENTPTEVVEKSKELFKQLKFDERVKSDYDFGHGILYQAFSNDNAVLADLVLDSGFDVASKVAMDGDLPLLNSAIFNERIHFLKSMLAHGANPDTKWQNLPALHEAVNQNNVEMVQLLIDHGADIDAVQHTDCTALDFAAHNGNLDIVRCLVENGANMFVVNDENKMAIDDCRKPEVIAYLKEAMMDPNKYQKNEHQFLQRICQMSVDDLVELPQKDPLAYKIIFKLDLLVTLFKKLPYSHQVPLYKATKDKMTANTQQQIQQVIRNKRNKSDSK